MAAEDFQKFRVWAYNALSGTNGVLGTQRAQLPFSDFTFERAFNSAESWSGSMPLYGDGVTRANLEPGNTAIVVEREGEILFVGALWSMNAQDNAVRVGGGGWMSWYDNGRRLLNSKVGMAYADTGGTVAANQISWTGKDQFRIAKDIIDHAATYAGASNVGFTETRYQGVSGGSLSGITRDRTMWDYEKRGVLDTLVSLTTIIDGLDFIPTFDWTDDSPPVPKVMLDLFYPRIGQSEDDPVATLVEDNHTRVTGYTRDGSKLANYCWAAGSGQGDAKKFGVATDSGLRYPTGSFPMLEHVESYSSVQEQANLDGHAEADLFELGYSHETVTIELRENAVRVGSLVPGDAVRVIADRGLIALNGVYRIASLSTTINANSQAVMSITATTPGASLGYAESPPE